LDFGVAWVKIRDVDASKLKISGTLGANIHLHHFFDGSSFGPILEVFHGNHFQTHLSYNTLLSMGIPSWHHGS
jgi:hypothetical protein